MLVWFISAYFVSFVVFVIVVLGFCVWGFFCRVFVLCVCMFVILFVWVFFI